MLHRAIPLLFLPAALWCAPEWALIRTVDGAQLEGQIQIRSIRVNSTDVSVSQIRSVQSAAPASDIETARIKQGLAEIQAADRPARDLAVEDLTAIGLPVMTPLLSTYKDTDQHEPRPLYRLFERIIPSYADAFDRTLSLVRLSNGEAIRGKLPDGSLEITAADGKKTALAWSRIRSLSVRQKTIQRSMQVHSLRHSTPIDYLDTGVSITATSKLNFTTRGFVRLSWDVDSWASDADGLKQPGSPAYKSNLIDGHPFGALVGRVGSKGAVFFIGKSAAITQKPAGRLSLAVNDNNHWQNNLGTFFVTMTATDSYDLGDPQ